MALPRPYYTSSEAVRMALQPDIPVTRPVLQPPPSTIPPSWGRPETSSLIKPSFVRAISGLAPPPPEPPPLPEPNFLVRGRRVMSPAPGSGKRPDLLRAKSFTHRDTQTMRSTAPFARSRGGGGGGSLGPSYTARPSMPLYNALYDPHMRDYFARRLGLEVRCRPE